MSKTKRKRYPAEFMAKIAREALKEVATIAEIATRFNIHPNQASEWKKQAIEGLTTVFAGKADRSDVVLEAEARKMFK